MHQHARHLRRQARVVGSRRQTCQTNCLKSCQSSNCRMHTHWHTGAQRICHQSVRYDGRVDAQTTQIQGPAYRRMSRTSPWQIQRAKIVGGFDDRRGAFSVPTAAAHIQIHRSVNAQTVMKFGLTRRVDIGRFDRGCVDRHPPTDAPHWRIAARAEQAIAADRGKDAVTASIFDLIGRHPMLRTDQHAAGIAESGV